MSRTDDLRQRGARDRTGGGGGAPFVHWGDDPAWVEGEVVDVWESQYGANVRLAVQARSNGLHAKVHDDAGKRLEEVGPGEEINVGLNHAALEGTVSGEDIGARIHFAFEGWAESQKPGGNRYRQFAVLDVPPPTAASAPADDSEDDDPMPF